jgi:hypothetical protein
MNQITTENLNRLGLLTAIVALALFYTLHNLIEPKALSRAVEFLVSATGMCFLSLFLTFVFGREGANFNATFPRLFFWLLVVLPISSVCLYFGWMLLGGQPQTILLAGISISLASTPFGVFKKRSN